MLRAQAALLCILAGIGSAVAQTRPTTDPAALRDLEIKGLEDQTADLPRLQADSPAEVVQFGVEDGHIALRSPLAKNGMKFRVLAKGMNGVVTLTTFPLEDPRRRAEWNFILVRQDLTHPGSGEVTVTLSVVAGRVLLSRDLETDDFLTSVQLLQDPPGMPPSIPPTPPLRLLVNIEDKTKQQTVVKLQESAADFVTLRRRSEAIVDRYLRPLFTELQQESAVFSIPAVVAQQVLQTGPLQPDPQLIKRINAVIADLGADEFPKRQAAAQQLAGMGQPAAFVIAKMDRSRFTPEQNTAINSFLAETLPLPPDEVKRMADDKSFLLDVLFTDDRALCQAALDRLSQIEGRKVELPFESDPIARAASVAKLRQELIPNQ